MEILDEAVFELFRQLEGYFRADAAFFVADAQAIAAIAALLYLGYKAWELIVGDEEWEILPLLRPFAITLVIVFWSSFITVIEYPFLVFEARTEAFYDNEANEVSLLMLEKNKLLTEYATKLSEVASDVENVSGDDGKDEASLFNINIDSIIQEAKGLYLIVMTKIKYTIEQIIQFIVLAIFQFCTYLIYFLQMFFKYILIVLGPLSFALSIFPAFRDSWSTWIGRFISVALYSVIARIVLVGSFKIIKYALNLEIQMFQILMADEEAFILHATASNTTITSFIVALLVGAAALLTIPVVSTWIVRTSGVGQAVGKMVQGGMSAVGGVAKAGTGGML